jgi:hypothetical protein
MALTKQIPMNVAGNKVTGITLDYHRITEINYDVDKTEKQLSVVATSYFDAEARRLPNSGGWSNPFEFTLAPADYDAITNLRAYCYGLLLTTEAFAGATSD